MKELELSAYAKVNICLDVLGRMDNGYHQVRMIMQTISLHDTLTLKICEEQGIFLRTDKEELGNAEDNLAYRAAKLLIEECHLEKGIQIDLKKRIPIAAGMAGGSTDAAAVLRGMNQLYELGLEQQELMNYGLKLGADVPYCIVGGTYLAEGIGEVLTALTNMPECYILAAKPPVGVSTKWVYENLSSPLVHPDVDGMLTDLAQGDLIELASKMGNVLEKVTIERYPMIQSVKEAMEQKGALKAMMSGSGPTVLGIFQTEEAMHQAYLAMGKEEPSLELFETTMVYGYQ